VGAVGQILWDKSIPAKNFKREVDRNRGLTPRRGKLVKVARRHGSVKRKGERASSMAVPKTMFGPIQGKGGGKIFTRNKKGKKNIEGGRKKKED